MTDGDKAADEPAATDAPRAIEETAAEESGAPDRPAAAGRAAEEKETAWQRRKRLAAVFGDVLPDATRDERGPDSGKGDGGKGDDWYRSQVPPHHG